MKRNILSLLLHPYKNRLMSKTVLKESIDRCIRNLLSLLTEHPHFKFNIVLPAYIVECINPLLLSQFRDFQKKGSFEWILTGYTEPFLSMSPPQLSFENVRYGLETYNDIAGETPLGYMPPFSNFEPSMIELLKNSGVHYLVVSKDLLPSTLQSIGGYWMAEHSGSSIPLIATTIIRHMTAPVDFKNWIEKIYASDKNESQGDLIAILQYQFPLREEGESDPFRWLKYAATEIDKHILNYQPVTFGEILRDTQPLGLQYIPASLMMGNANLVDLHFLNYLHSFDQIGIMQRKLMDLYTQVSEITDPRISLHVRKELFFIQDINRFLPGKDSGFENTNDRLWTFSKMIELEKEISEQAGNNGGQIRITDFLRNGNKSIILSNKSVKLYIDYSCGGTIFEFDYRDRRINLCSAYNPVPHSRPDILAAGKSRAWFTDRLFNPETSAADILNGRTADLGNFLNSQFTYKVSKNATGIRAALTKHGALLRNDKPCPLILEKVYGLEQNTSALSFVYQFSNQSLTPYTFRFTTELSFSLPGLQSGNVRIVNGKQIIDKIGIDHIQIEGATRWYFEDTLCGLRILFQTQKPLDIWCLPTLNADQHPDPSLGIRILLTTNIILDSSAGWKLIGKLSCKRMRKASGDIDVL
jgi:hypothetical protein